jgi:hypothetical protein
MPMNHAQIQRQAKQDANNKADPMRPPNIHETQHRIGYRFIFLKR